jgi:3,4-dihydroxy-2-butanone 4-phosphate synthase
MLKFLSVKEAVTRLLSGEKVLLVDDEKLDSTSHYVQFAESALETNKISLLHSVPGMVMIALGYDKYASVSNALKDTNNEFMIPMVTLGAANLGYALNDQFFTSLMKTLVKADASNDDFRFDVGYQTYPVKLGGTLKKASPFEAIIDLTYLAKVEPVGILSPSCDGVGRMLSGIDNQQLKEETQLHNK